MFGKVKHWFGKLFWRNRPDQFRTGAPREPLLSAQEAASPALEMLTDQLVAETVGDGGILDQEFHRILSAYNADNNPIDRRQAELLLSSLLRTAISRRKLLNERIVRSIESGQLHHQYYDRLHAVSALAVDAYSKMRVMDLARQDYLFHSNMLEKVQRKSHRADMQPGEDELPKPPEPDQDLFRGIDQAAGLGREQDE